jgi:hypothetical protein
VPTANESVAIVSTFPRNFVTNVISLAPPFANLDTRGGLPVAPSFESVLPGDDNSTFTHNASADLCVYIHESILLRSYVTSDPSASRHPLLRIVVPLRQTLLVGLCKPVSYHRPSVLAQLFKPLCKTVGHIPRIEGAVFDDRRRVSA